MDSLSQNTTEVDSHQPRQKTQRQEHGRNDRHNIHPAVELFGHAVGQLRL